MVIDISALLLVLLFGFFGYRSGFITQLFRLLALVAGFAAAWFLTPSISESVARGLSIDPFLAGVAVFLGLFFLVSLAVGLVGGAISRAIRGEHAALTFFDRGLGGLLGAAKGIVLVYVAIALTWTLQPTFERAKPALEASIVAAEVQRHNVMDEVFEWAFAAWHALNLLGDPALIERAKLDPEFQRRVLATEHGRVFADPDLLSEPRGWKLLADSRVRELLADPDVLKALADYDVEALRSAVPPDGGALQPPPEKAPYDGQPPRVVPPEAPPPAAPAPPIP